MASVDNKIVEIFIPGPAGRLEAKYYKSKKIRHQLRWFCIHILSTVEQ